MNNKQHVLLSAYFLEYLLHVLFNLGLGLLCSSFSGWFSAPHALTVLQLSRFNCLPHLDGLHILQLQLALGTHSLEKETKIIISCDHAIASDCF